MTFTREDLAKAVTLVEVAGIDPIDFGESILKACVEPEVFEAAYAQVVSLVAKKRGISVTAKEDGVEYSFADGTTGLLKDVAVEDAIKELVYDNNIVSSAEYIDAVAEEICRVTGITDFEV